MSSAVDRLETRVVAAAELIASLRTKVKSLERELMSNNANAIPPPASPRTASPPDPAPLEELERLRSERVEVREIIRGLLREIDRVSW